MESVSLEFSEKQVPDVYHGTTSSSAQDILRSGFTKGYNNTSFLGSGVYFYEGSQAWALGYARRKFKGRKLAVTRSTIQCGLCLDLTDKGHQELLQHLVDSYKRRFNKNVTDSQAVNIVANKTKVDTVKAIHGPERPRPLFASSRFLGQVRIMWCVRNLSMILNTASCYEGF